MPPKVPDISTLIGKRDNALSSLYELFEEFQLVMEHEPDLRTELIKNIYDEIEPKYRSIRQQIETIADRGIEIGLTSEDPVILRNSQIGAKVKTDFFNIKQAFIAYRKKHNVEESKAESPTEGLKEMNLTLRKMVETLGSQSNDKGHGLEKLSVPTWDGKRKTYKSWKKEFNHWMNKYKQDKDEQLQRFRKALPQNSWLCDHARTCKSIEKAWEILDQEFGNQRKIMDELLKEVTNQKSVKSDSKSLSHYATKIDCFVNDMEDNGCYITTSSEAPFIMSQLLSKLDPKDNVCFGREMLREKKEENVTNLIEWLRLESFMRSRGKEDTVIEKKVIIDSHAVERDGKEEECPLCKSNHLLSACLIYQNSTVDEKWNTVRKSNLCRKCLRSHHTKDCHKGDGTTCTQCTRNHHRSLHSEKSNLEVSPSQEKPTNRAWNSQVPRQPWNSQVPRQPWNSQVPRQPWNSQVPRQPRNSQVPRQPWNSQVPRQEFSSKQVPQQSSGNQIPRQSYNNLVESQIQLESNENITTSQAQLQSPTDFFTSNLQQSRTNSVQRANLTVICPVQKVNIKDKDGNLIQVIAMIDSGSNTSLLSKETAGKRRLTGEKTHLTMNLAGGSKRSEMTEELEIFVSPLSEETTVSKRLNVYTVQKPCSPAKTISKKLIESFDHLKPICDNLFLNGGTVDLLIGVDFPDAFVDVQVRQGKEGEPIAKQNCFGWYVLGKFKDDDNHINSVDVGTVSALDDVKKLLTQDMMGVQRTHLCTYTDNILKENKFIKSISESTKMINGRIQIKMPWKETGPPKKSNFVIALKRMKSTEKTFYKKHCYKEIEEEVEKLVEQGFVIEVPENEINHSEAEWYLPMHAVFTPERTTNIRLVFDASAKGEDGLSLNDHLEKGPNYINDLTSVIMAWRWDQVAYAGDIRKMFNQVSVHPDDQVYHRFLFRKSSSLQPTICQWQRLNFGDKPAPDIATGCVITLAKLSQEEFPEASQELLKHVYVDDIGGSRAAPQDANRITGEIDTILAKGKFQVKAWHYNDGSLDKTKEQHTDFLGRKWDKKNDTFSFKKDKVDTAMSINFTKRSCLSILSKLWDPIGLVAPVTIKFRIDLQELWSAGYSWDDVLPDDIQQKWIENLQVMNQLVSTTFDRKLKPSDAIGYPELHGFSDGSELAYGAVLFLRWRLQNQEYYCVPLLAKVFVAPLKKKTIPRLELMGCLVLSRIYNACKDALEFMSFEEWEKYLWLDSMTVLSWIKTSPKKFKPFVSARVAEIQENTDVGTHNFRYIESKHNPADSLTRGIQTHHIEKWIQGPKFLYRKELPSQSKDNYVEYSYKEKCELKCKQITDKVNKENKEQEEKNVEINEDNDINVGNEVEHHFLSANCKNEKENPILKHLMETCSTFHKVRKTLAYVRRFIHNGRTAERIQAQYQLKN